MSKVTDIISIIILGGVGYVAYKFWKGEWTLPRIPTPGEAGFDLGKALLDFTTGTLRGVVSPWTDLFNKITSPQAWKESELGELFGKIQKQMEDPIRSIGEYSAAREKFEQLDPRKIFGNR